MRALAVAGKVLDKIVDYFAYGGAIILGFIIVVVLADVILRSFFTYSIIWAGEVTNYSILWFTFMAMAWVLKLDKHVVMDLIISRLSPKPKRMLLLVASILALGACLVFTYYAVKVNLNFIQKGITESTIIRPPSWAVNIIVPLGSFLLCLQYGRKIAASIAETRAEGHPTIDKFSNTGLAVKSDIEVSK